MKREETRKIAIIGTRKPHPGWARSVRNIAYLIARAGVGLNLIGTTHQGGVDELVGQGVSWVDESSVIKYLPKAGHRQGALRKGYRKKVAERWLKSEVLRLHPEPEKVDAYGMLFLKAVVAAVRWAIGLILVPNVHRDDTAFADTVARAYGIPVIDLARGRRLEDLLRLESKLPSLEAQDLWLELCWLYRAAGLWDHETWVDRMESAVRVMTSEIAPEGLHKLTGERLAELGTLIPHSLFWECAGRRIVPPVGKLAPFGILLDSGERRIRRTGPFEPKFLAYRASELGRHDQEDEGDDVMAETPYAGWRMAGVAAEPEMVIWTLGHDVELPEDPIRLRVFSERWARRYFVLDASEEPTSRKAPEFDSGAEDPDADWRYLYRYHDTGNPGHDREVHLADVRRAAPGLAVLARECEAKESGLVMAERFREGVRDRLLPGIRRFAREHFRRDLWDLGKDDRALLFELRDTLELLELSAREARRMLREVSDAARKGADFDTMLPGEELAPGRALQIRIDSARRTTRAWVSWLQHLVTEAEPESDELVKEEEPDWRLLERQIRSRLSTLDGWKAALGTFYKLEEAKALWRSWDAPADEELEESQPADDEDTPEDVDDDVAEPILHGLSVVERAARLVDQPQGTVYRVQTVELPGRDGILIMKEELAARPMVKAWSKELGTGLTTWQVVGRWKGEESHRDGPSSSRHLSVNELLDAMLGARTLDELYQAVAKTIDAKEDPDPPLGCVGLIETYFVHNVTLTLEERRSLNQAFLRRMEYLKCKSVPYVLKESAADSTIANFHTGDLPARERRRPRKGAQKRLARARFKAVGGDDHPAEAYRAFLTKGGTTREQRRAKKTIFASLLRSDTGETWLERAQARYSYTAPSQPHAATRASQKVRIET